MLKRRPSIFAARRQRSDVIPIAGIDVHIEQHRFIEAAGGGFSPLEMPWKGVCYREWLFTGKKTSLDVKHFTGFLSFILQ